MKKTKAKPPQDKKKDTKEPRKKYMSATDPRSLAKSIAARFGEELWEGEDKP